MPSALVLVAEGSEEIEAITPGDVLVRAGVAVTYAGLGGTMLRGSRGLPLGADVEIDDVGDRLYDAVVIPGGGPGSERLGASEPVRTIVQRHHAAGKLIAAICAAPANVLAPAGILAGRSATGYPGTEARFGDDVDVRTDAVVEHEHVITSRGPGTAMAFALAVASRLVGGEKACQVAGEMLVGASG